MMYLNISYKHYMDVVNFPYSYALSYSELRYKNATYGQYRVSAFESELLTLLLPKLARKVRHLEK